MGSASSPSSMIRSTFQETSQLHSMESDLYLPLGTRKSLRPLVHPDAICVETFWPDVSLDVRLPLVPQWSIQPDDNLYATLKSKPLAPMFPTWSWLTLYLTKSSSFPVFSLWRNRRIFSNTYSMTMISISPLDFFDRLYLCPHRNEDRWLILGRFFLSWWCRGSGVFARCFFAGWLYIVEITIGRIFTIAILC
jgi:hypothetical protein